MTSDVLSFAFASGVAERALPQRKIWPTRTGQMRGRSSAGVDVSRRQTTRSSGGTNILLDVCRLEFWESGSSMAGGEGEAIRNKSQAQAQLGFSTVVSSWVGLAKMVDDQKLTSN